MKCPNINHPDFQEVVNKVGLYKAYELWMQNGEEYVDSSSIAPSITNVDNALSVYNQTNNADLIKQFMLPIEPYSEDKTSYKINTTLDVIESFDGKESLIQPLVTFNVDNNYKINNLNIAPSKITTALKQNPQIIKDTLSQFAKENNIPYLKLGKEIIKGDDVLFDNTDKNSSFYVPEQEDKALLENLRPKLSDIQYRSFKEYPSEEKMNNLQELAYQKDINKFHYKNNTLPRIKVGNLEFIKDRVKVENKFGKTNDEYILPEKADFEKHVKNKMAKNMFFEKQLNQQLEQYPKEKEIFDTYNKMYPEDMVAKDKLPRVLDQTIKELFNNIYTESGLNQIMPLFKDIIDTAAKELGIDPLDSYNNYNEIIRESGNTVLGMKVKTDDEILLDSVENKVKFVGGYMGSINPHTLVPEREHYYLDQDNNKIPYSVTMVSTQYPEFVFSEFDYIMNAINRNPHLKKHFADEPKDSKRALALIDAVLTNDLSIFEKAATDGSSKYIFLPHRGEERTFTISLKGDKFYPHDPSLPVPDGIEEHTYSFKASDPKELKYYAYLYNRFIRKELEKEFYNLVESKRSHALSALVGTQEHELIQAIIKDENDRSAQDIQILSNLDQAEKDLQVELAKADAFIADLAKGDKSNLFKRIRSTKYSENAEENERTQEAIIAQIKKANLTKLHFTNDTIGGKNINSVIYALPDEISNSINRIKNKIRYLNSLVEIKKKFTQFKEDVKKNGGIIRTEFRIMSNNFITHNKDKASIASQIDILVYYGDNDNVPDNLKKTLRVYDIKTMRDIVEENSPSFYINDKANNTQKGYKPGKQAKHAFQLLMYAEMLKLEFGSDHKIEAFVIPISLGHFENTPEHIAMSRTLYNTDRNAYIQAVRNATENNVKLFDASTRKLTNIRDKKISNYGFDINVTALHDYHKNKMRAKLSFDEQYFEQEAAKTAQEKQKQEERKTKALEELDNLINDIKVHINFKISLLNKTLNKDPEQHKKDLSLIKRLQNDLEGLTSLQQLSVFIENSWEAINGDQPNKNKGLEEKYALLMLAYKNGDLQADELIRELDTIRLHLQSYDILDEIKRELDKYASVDEIAAFRQLQIYKNLESAITTRNKVLDTYYDDIADIIAERLASFASKDADYAVKELDRINRERIQNNIEYHQSELAKGNNVDYNKARIESLEKELIRLDETIKNLKFDKETIKQELIQSSKDISFLDLHIFSGISTSDKLLSLYAKLVKYQLIKGEHATKDYALQLEKALSDLEKAGVKLDYKNLDKTYDPVLEMTDEWVRDPETGEYKSVKVYQLISKYGTQPHTLEDGTTVQMSHHNIIKDYHYRLGKLYKSGDPVAYRKLKDQFEQWKQNNLEAEYTDEYYIWKNSLDPEIKNILDEIDAQITEIKDGALMDKSDHFPLGRNSYFLTDEERLEIRKLQLKKKQLASETDEMGVKKTGKDLEIAQKLKAYNEGFSKFYNYETNLEVFENNRAKAISIYGKDSVEFKKWEASNTNIVLKEDFIKRYGMLRSKVTLTDFAFEKNYRLGVDPKVKEFLYETEELNLEPDEWKEALDKFLNEMGWFDEYYNFVENNTLDLNQELNTITKPFRQRGIPQPDLASDEILKKIRDLEQAISNQREQEYIESKMDLQNASGAYKKAFYDYIGLRSLFSEASKNMVDYLPIDDYYVKLSQVKEEAKKAGIYYRDTSWYKNNHYQVMIDGKPEMRPTRIWTQMVPANASTEANSKYFIDRDAELQTIREKYPDANEEKLNTLLSQTKWYLSNHGKNEVITNKAYLRVSRDDRNVSLEPTQNYSNLNIKEEFVRQDPNIRDINGYLLPLTHKKGKAKTEANQLWLNPKYAELQKNPALFKFYNTVLAIYHDIQSKLPTGYRLNNTIPFARKERITHIVSTTEGAANKAAAVWRYFKDSSLNSMAEQDVLDAKISSKNNINNRFLPMHYTNHVEIEDVNKDILNTILMYAGAATKHYYLAEILGETRALLSLVERRESPSGKGTILRDSLGNPIKDADAAKAGIDRNQRIDGESKSLEKLRTFIEMQIFDEMNIPIEKSFLNYKIRVDKLGDFAMGLASMFQIGGTTAILWGSGAALVKGLANSLNANYQIMVESAAGQFFNKGIWTKAKFRYMRYGHKDIIGDFGKLTRTSLTGQLFDHYDPLQGNFTDKLGRQLPKGKIAKLITSEMWYLNQYLGEYDAAMTSLYSYLMSHKIVNGEVYNLQEYLASKGSNLKRSEKLQYEAEFNALEDSLLDAFELDNNGKLKVKAGVNWELGSKRDFEMQARLHAITKSMQGAYAKFDKTKLERHVVGRAVMMYKKYLAPAIDRRFGTMQRNEELGMIREGYYRTFLKYAFQDLLEMGNMLRGRRGKSDKYSRFTLLSFLNPVNKNVDALELNDIEYNNLRRSTKELGMLILLSLIVGALAPDDDEDKKQITSLRWLMLYELERLRKEINGLTMVHPKAIEDNWKIIKSPSAFSGFFDRFVRFAMQFSDPFETYEKSQGTAEKGDSKLWVKFLKLFGNAKSDYKVYDSDNFSKSLRESYDNLNRAL